MNVIGLAAGVGRQAVEPTPAAVWVFGILAAAAGLWVLARALRALRRPVQARPEFVLPEDISSAQAGFLTDGEADDRDLLSLILDFARRGFLTISSDEWDGGDPDQTPLVLEKRRDLPENAPAFERTVFGALFAGGQTLCHLTRPGQGFSDGLETAKAQLQDSFSGQRALYRNRTGLWSMAWPFAGCLLLFLCLSRAGVGRALAACVPLVLLAVLARLAFRRWRFLRNGARAVWAGAGAALALAAGAGGTACALGSSTPLWLTAPAFLLVLAGCLVAPLTAEPTDYHRVTAARLSALFRFLEEPETGRLTELLDDDPDCFYTALPYAYVFGLADEWAEAFEPLCRHAPVWYTNGYQDFSTGSFVRSFRYSVEAALAGNDEE